MTNLISLWYIRLNNLCYSVGSPFRHSLLVIIFLSIYIFATLLLIRTNIASTKCILYLLTSILWSRNRSDIFEHIPWFCTPFRGNYIDNKDSWGKLNTMCFKISSTFVLCRNMVNRSSNIVKSYIVSSRHYIWLLCTLLSRSKQYYFSWSYICPNITNETHCKRQPYTILLFYTS